MAQPDDDWKFVSEYPIADYQCGIRVGERVRLKRDIVMWNHHGKPTGEVFAAVEIWAVLKGSAVP